MREDFSFFTTVYEEQSVYCMSIHLFSTQFIDINDLSISFNWKKNSKIWIWNVKKYHIMHSITLLTHRQIPSASGKSSWMLNIVYYSLRRVNSYILFILYVFVNVNCKIQQRKNDLCYNSIIKSEETKVQHIDTKDRHVTCKNIHFHQMHSFSCLLISHRVRYADQSSWQAGRQT